MELSHVDKQGDARMVDVSGKAIVHRVAVAAGRIELQRETVRLIRENLVKKGDVLSVARIAAIMGGKRTSELIPLCHNIPINSIDVAFEMGEDAIDIEARAVCDAKTGIEMEALTAVSVAALTIYDMCKAVDKSMRITGIHLKEKTKHAV